jgi:PAS domain S-box-containing protein
MKHQPKTLASQTLRPGAPLVAQRVAERFSAEDSRQDVFDFLRAVTENLSEGLYALDAAGCLTFMNQAAERMLGWTETELRGNDMHATIHFQHADGTPFPRDECSLLQVIRAGHTHHVEDDMFTRKDGSTFPVAYISSPIITGGVVTGAVLVFHDITAHRALDEALRRSEREAASQASQLLAIFESIADAVIVYDREGNILRANAADAEILGLRQPLEAPVRTLGERDQMFTVVDEDGHPISSDQWPSARVLKGEVLRGSSAADILLRTVDGQDIVLNASGAPVRDAEGNIVGGVLIGRDVTQRRRLEQQTHEALTALMTMAEALTSNDMAFSDNTLASARPAAMRLAELTRAVMGCERVGVHVYDLETRLAYTLAVAGLTKEQEQLAAHTYTARMNNPPETVKRLQAGDVVAIDLTCPPYDRWPNPLGSRSILLAPISVGGPILGDISVDYGAVEHRPTAGEIAMARTIAKLAAQIIERGRLAHEREEARANALALVETTRRMDEFLSIAAHELKTPVTNSMLTVTLASVMLKRFIADAEVSPTAQDALMADTLRPLLKLLERTSNHMNQLSRLVVDLLDISRIRDGKLEMRVGACNLADLVRDVVEEQRQLAPGRAIRLRLPAASRRAPIVRADTDRIRQVVANYLSNALKYSRDGRQVNVEVRTDDEWARVSVRDHGPGVPRAEQRRVWECCYRVEGTQVLSGTSVGLGLGLYISRSIIEQHNGRVGLRSTEGQGAAFWFALPLMTPAMP